MSLQSKGLWRRMEEVQVLKNRKVKSCSYCDCIALVKTLLHHIHTALKPSFPSLAGWRSGCSICLKFTTLSSCLFVHLFLSGHFSPHLQLSGKERSTFRPWVTRSSHRPRAKSQRAVASFTKRHTHACTKSHTPIHNRAALPSFPYNFGLWVCLLVHTLTALK